MVKSAKFELSIADPLKQSPSKKLPQFAFVGRSNVGKSSLLNMLVNQKKLAVTSSTPGRTRLINFFNVHLSPDTEIYLVDLPGYGFAAASKQATGGWNESIGHYLTREKNLKRVFVLIDIRHKPTDLDLQMLGFLQSNDIPFSIIATKADKLSRPQVQHAVQTLTSAIGVARGDIIVTSASNAQGRSEVLGLLTKE